MNSHHESFVAALRQCQHDAGGPTSLSQFLRLGEKHLRSMRDKKVTWAWIAARVLAVHQTTAEANIPEDIPDARRPSTRLISSLWSRVRAAPSRHSQPSDKVSRNNQLSDLGGTTSDCAGHVGQVDDALATGPPKRLPLGLMTILQDHDTVEQLGRFSND